MDSLLEYLSNLFNPKPAVAIAATKKQPFVIERLIDSGDQERKQVTVGLVSPSAQQAIRIGPMGSPVFPLREVNWKVYGEDLEYSFVGDVKLALKKNLDKTVEYTVTAPNFKQSHQIRVGYKTIAMGSDELDQIAKILQ
jgi:hypothetical protein